MAHVISFSRVFRTRCTPSSTVLSIGEPIRWHRTAAEGRDLPSWRARSYISEEHESIEHGDDPALAQPSATLQERDQSDR